MPQQGLIEILVKFRAKVIDYLSLFTTPITITTTLIMTIG